MFGIGWTELVLIIVIALIVLGPERIPQVFTTMGRILRELRATSAELKEELTRTVEESELKGFRTQEPLGDEKGTSATPPPPSSAPLQEPQGFGTPVKVKRS